MESPSLTQKLAAYTPNDDVKELLAATPIVLLVGISGAGKDTIMRELFTRYPGQYHHIVSHTTRAPRENKGVMEQDGVAYHFIDFVTAEHMLDNHAYIEAKQYSSNVYGTSVAEFQMAHDEGKVAITDLEVQGADEYVKLTPSVKPIFILPPSFEVWRQRVATRYGSDMQEHQEDLQKRFAAAKRELQHALEVDYFYFVINDDLDRVVAEVHQIATGQLSRGAQQAVARPLVEELLAKIG